jgi:O-antigen ligase
MKKIALILVVLLASLLGGYLSAQWGITLFFLSTVLLLFTLGPDFQLRKDEALILLFAFCGAASVLYAGDKWGAILFSGSFMAGSLFYIILRNSSDWEPPLLQTVVVGGCIVGLGEALRQVNLVPYALFYNPNPFSGFLTPLVPVSLYLYARYREKIYLVASGLLVFANFISASRTGVVTMILAFIAMGFFFYRDRDRASVKALLLVFIVGFCSFLLFSATKDALMLKGADGMLEKQPTGIIQRVYLLETTLQVIRQAPFLGQGLNSFQAAMGMISNPYVVFPAVHAHSLYLNILAELGIVGVALFLCFLVMVLKGPVYPSFLLKVALLSFLFHNIVEYNFPPPPFQVLIYLLCAAIMRGKTPEQSLLHITGRTARIIPALVALYLIVVHLYPATGLVLLDRANAALQKGDIAKTVRYLFASTYFGYPVPLVHAGTAHLLTDVYFSSNAKDNNLLKIAEKNYLKALALNSLDGPLYVDIAAFYAATGRPDRAQTYLSDAIEKYPYHQQYRLALARFCAGQGRYEEAVQILDTSNAFLKDYAPLNPLRVDIFLELARIHHQQGDRVGSEDLIAKARRLKDLLEGPRAPK